jgi:hypothetical protein
MPGTYTTPVTLLWTPGNSCTLSVVSPTAVATGTQLVFAQWQDGTTATSDKVTAPSASAVYTASFTTEYQLTTAAGTGGSISAGVYFAAGSNAMITATPSAGYYFVNFTGATTSTSNPLTLPINGPESITANFATQIAPTLIFAPISLQLVGAAPFAVSATSASNGAVTYAVTSGPATIADNVVTVTGVGTVVLTANRVASGSYAAATATTSFTVSQPAPTIPTLTFAPIPTKEEGAAPFMVSATSASTEAVTYAVTSGPATIAGNIVTVTGTGTVVLAANQAASGNYTAATATTSFTVGLPFTLGISTGSSTSVAAGAAASFSLTLTPAPGTTLPDPIFFTATGLPRGATATFSPAILAAGGATTTVTLSIQTASSQTARNEQPITGNPLAPVTLGFLLLPLLAIKAARQRMRLPLALLAVVLSLGAVLGISGCSSSSATPPMTAAPQTYTVVVTATDTTTKIQSSTNLTLTVQ